MRKLSKTFLDCLKSGFLSQITEYVKRDHDLNLEIRDSYINVYYKGNSLLKLIEADSLLHYKSEIHKKFLEGVKISLDFTESTVPQFVKISHSSRKISSSMESIHSNSNMSK